MPDITIATEAAPAHTPAPAKPGWKTSEFYMKLAAILLTALFASGVIPTSGTPAMIAAIAATMLGALGYTVSRTLVKIAALLLIVGLATQTMACSASAREKTIRTTYAATNAAADQLVSYSHDHEAELVAKATSLETGKAALVAYRTKADHVEKTLGAVYRAIATAALLEDDRSLSALVQVAVILSTELHDLGVLK